jgi:hypothetical protein
MATVLPVLGPLILLDLIYSFPREGRQRQGNLSGLIPAILKLRANGMMVFVLLLFLFILFAFLHSRHDPYFKRRTPNHPSSQSALNTGQPAMIAWTVSLKKGEEFC